ncbi:PVC-type heme-binding CxxCH protein [Paludisphaera rhizosphaerae]|uniref:PVC-type heme-binding CxxCH protein n=1 Tax=Paludisphaera rhizosphaerae TaxID=2711216 RepID=UPI0013EC9F97|nr:PVC-type heme-binding CxxCH protein [Paludisphaera rhizosphaerae]
MTRAIAAVGILGVALAIGASASAQAPDPYAGKIATASDAGVRAIQGFSVAPGLKVELFAGEPLVANPVTLSIDGRNRIFVAETFRYHAGVTDIRRHMTWLDDDLSGRTIEDRLAMLRKHMGAEAETYGVEHDRIRMVEDGDGDGKADRSTIFADGFNEILGGIGAGVLARGDSVWFACIPDLWRLRDTNGDGKADERLSLHRGFGVHVGYLGHDLHGLRLGPDGRLYFSIGDRGFNIPTPDGRRVVEVETGAVLRCEPDGSKLEIYATGLRNPQELAFDDHGNLFTCDNNSDGGDKARWVHVVEGGDSGWRMGYQYLETPTSRGPWNAERLWDSEGAKHALSMIPPLANIADGPSGLVCDPGVGFPAEYRGKFFLCDFRATANQSGIQVLTNEPDGATFRLADARKLVWGVLATDVEFGADGALYFTDWVEKFSSPSKGRIYRIVDPSSPSDPQVARARELLAQGFEKRSVDELAGLLAFPDRRIRQEAQLALADHGPEGAARLASVAKANASPLARLHAIWGLGQLGRRNAEALMPLLPLLTDADPEVRGQVANLLGEGRVAAAFDGLIAATRDKSPRVRFFAAMALGKIGRSEAVGPILEMLRRNADKDAYLRHSGVMGLAGIGDVPALLAAAGDDSPAVRAGVLLTLRRLKRPEVARFLTDADPALVLEAARAINDALIPEALPALASTPAAADSSEPLLRRIVNANLRLGGKERAEALAAIAARSDLPAGIRMEALDALRDWPAPSAKDRIVGLWRPIDPRPADEAVAALAPVLNPLLNGSPELVRQGAARAAGGLALADASPALKALIVDRRRASATRVEALRALETMGATDADLAERAADDDAVPVRNEALRILAVVRPEQAVKRLEARIGAGPVAERQGALRTLGAFKSPVADDLLSTWLDRLIAGSVPPEIRLDVLEAARGRNQEEIRRKIAVYEAARPKDDPVARFAEALMGGNAAAGRKVFNQKLAVACVRCHKVDGQGGEVGPDLSAIGAAHDRNYLLEAIVAPSRQIAPGFETRVVATNDGRVHVGVLRSEDAESVKLVTPDGAPLTIPKSTIEDQRRGDSAMPEDIIANLSKFELRDLVEFLARRRAASPGAKPEP